jgi:hypothetical protein
MDSSAKPENAQPVSGCPVYQQKRGMEDVLYERPLTSGRVTSPVIVTYLKIWKREQL